jgi:hypothetical protein
VVAVAEGDGDFDPEGVGVGDALDVREVLVVPLVPPA